MEKKEELKPIMRAVMKDNIRNIVDYSNEQNLEQKDIVTIMPLGASFILIYFK